MKKIEDLKIRDRIYRPTLSKIYHYDFLCQLPAKNPDKLLPYYIMINENEKPVRLYEDDLLKILELNCFTYEDARTKQLELIKEELKNY